MTAGLPKRRPTREQTTPSRKGADYTATSSRRGSTSRTWTRRSATWSRSTVQLVSAAMGKEQRCEMTLEELLNATTVSAHGLDITIACDDHATKDKILDLLLGGEPREEPVPSAVLGNKFKSAKG